MDGGDDALKQKGSGFYLLRAVPAIVLLLLLFFIPIILIFTYAFEDGFDAILAVLRDDYTYYLLLFTIKEALLSALLSVLIALPFAAYFSKYTFPGRRIVLTISQLAFTIPTILVVLGFVIWYGNNGYLNNAIKTLFSIKSTPLQILYSFKAIILAHVYLNFPIAFALITAAWTALPDNLEKASYLLGKGKIETFCRITLPRLSGSIASSFALIFLYCFSSFAIVMVLGGNPAYSTLEVEIYRRVHVNADIKSAAALAIFAFAVNALLLIITTPGRKVKKGERKGRVLIKAHGALLAEAIVLSLLILLFLIPPMAAIAVRAFFTRDGIFTTRAWQGIFEGGFGLIGSALNAIYLSFIIGLIVALLSVWMGSAIAMASAKRSSRILPFISSLPLAAGSVMMGLGLLLVTSFISTELGIRNYYLSILFVIAAHLVIVLPFSVRTITPGARMIPDTLEKASSTLGVNRGKTYRRVESPLLAPYRRKAFAFSFALSLGEVNATLMLSSGNVETIPVLIYRMIGSYDYQGAAALGTVLLLLALIVFAAGEMKWRKDAVL